MSISKPRVRKYVVKVTLEFKMEAVSESHAALLIHETLEEKLPYGLGNPREVESIEEEEVKS